MKAIKTLEESQNSLLESFDELDAILKAIGHHNRFKILILLLTGPLTFQSLLNKMNLGKTALANHLTHLKSKNLIEKIQHGNYSISPDGKDYLLAIETVYDKTEARKTKLKEAQQKYHLTKSFLERKKRKS
ncbi:MAG: ArsR/SmtB family transcription factor [Candidatus Hodarchaeota archaeon]